MDRKKTIIWDDPKLNQLGASNSISGLDYLTAIRDGNISPPPVAMLIGYKISEVQKGYVVFELNPAEYHLNPYAVVHGGILSTLLDTAMGSSVLSTLERGFIYSTVDIKVDFIRPANCSTGILRCEARPINIGKRIAISEGYLKDLNNKLYAYGTNTCLINKVKV